MPKNGNHDSADGTLTAAARPPVKPKTPSMYAAEHSNEKTGVVVPPPGSATVDDEKPIPVVFDRDSALAPGLMKDDIYDSQMSWWRVAIRKRLVGNLKAESEMLAAMQGWIRKPALDTYFVYTSTLGTHTFFMTMLPTSYFFGHDDAGRGLVFVIGMGVYLSSLIKDSICSPRPFAPPVTRLTIGTHHLEYGFPSTHSTNSVSIALHFWYIIYTMYSASQIPYWVYMTGVVGLVWYVFSIVFGRLYCAMHSFTDCAAGVALGTSIWLAQWSFGDILAKWISSSGWQVPLITIPLGLSLVNQHPDPVDDCPCFEDAIAFLSVLMGVTLSQWWRANWGFDEASGHFQSRMPSDWPMWTLIASAKMVLGVFIIFAFRLVAKPTLLAILPPIFRGLSTLFTLPNRRYYTPATDYQSVPREPLLHHPIPSVIDLPTLNTQQESGVSLPTSRNNKGLYGNTLKLRGTAGNGNGSNHTTNGTRLQEKAGNGDAAVVIQPSNSAPPDKVKHYDADVLTKVIVYAGIAFLASGVIPVLFEWLGWGVYSDR